MQHWIALAFAIFFNVISNIALKKAVTSIGEAENKIDMIIKLLWQPAFWLGIFTAGLLLIMYLYALRGLPVSIAYATVTSLAMIGLMFMGYFFFEETIKLSKVLGTVLVISGVFLLTTR